jgi:hypothetical protein
MTPDPAIDLHNLNPKDLLNDDAFEEYDSGMGFFFSELVDLNTIIYLAEQIVAFPFDLFATRDNQTFFSMVLASFHDSAILAITRLVTDQKGDLFTLIRFKNRVRELVKEEFRPAFELRLKNARFDNKVSALLAKARDLRDHRIGHITRDFVAGNIRVFRPNLSELRELRDALNSLLDALAFNVEYAMLPLPYDDRVRPRTKPDIEEILDNLAKNSHYLNLPEQYPERWKYRRPHLSKEDLDALNHYRRKFAMSEV